MSPLRNEISKYILGGLIPEEFKSVTFPPT